PSGAGPTRPSAPGTPAIVWHPPQPYRVINRGARAESPPVMLCAIAARSRICPSPIAPRARTMIAAANTRANRPPVEGGSLGSVAVPSGGGEGLEARLPRRRDPRLPHPGRKVEEGGGGIDAPCRNPHDEPG